MQFCLTGDGLRLVLRDSQLQLCMSKVDGEMTLLNDEEDEEDQRQRAYSHGTTQLAQIALRARGSRMQRVYQKDKSKRKRWRLNLLSPNRARDFVPQSPQPAGLSVVGRLRWQLSRRQSAGGRETASDDDTVVRPTSAQRRQPRDSTQVSTLARSPAANSGPLPSDLKIAQQ